jgi:predicted aspartyl protease
MLKSSFFFQNGFKSSRNRRLVVSRGGAFKSPTDCPSSFILLTHQVAEFSIMSKFVVPNLQGKQIGQVIVTLTVTNRIDQVLAERGFITAEEVRFCNLTDVLVDTGAILLCLPSAVITQLGLVLGGEASVETAAGVQKGRIFRDVELSIEDRRGTFDCLELTEVPYALLGVIPMEVLGLEPDLKNRKLRLLPMNSEQTYLSIL